MTAELLTGALMALAAVVVPLALAAWLVERPYRRRRSRTADRRNRLT